MIKKVLIEKISRFTTDRENKPLKTKDGKPYTRVLLTVQGKTISGFGSQQNAEWKSGDTVQIDITSVNKNGQTYYNFSNVSLTGELLERMKFLEDRVRHLEDELLTSDGHKVPDFKEVNQQKIPSTNTSAGTVASINPDDVPF